MAGSKIALFTYTAVAVGFATYATVSSMHPIGIGFSFGVAAWLALLSIDVAGES